MLNLKELRIERDIWAKEKGAFKGKATFEGAAGEVTINLTPELHHRLFLLCSEAIISTAKIGATALLIEAQATVAQAAQPAALS